MEEEENSGEKKASPPHPLAFVLEDVEKDEVVAVSTQFPKLKQELDSWRNFAQSLRKEDRDLYREMISKIWSTYSDAIENSDRGYTTESLLVSLILAQQKTIDWLSKQISLLKGEEEEKSERIMVEHVDDGGESFEADTTTLPFAPP